MPRTGRGFAANCRWDKGRFAQARRSDFGEEVLHDLLCKLCRASALLLPDEAKKHGTDKNTKRKAFLLNDGLFIQGERWHTALLEHTGYRNDEEPSFTKKIPTEEHTAKKYLAGCGMREEVPDGSMERNRNMYDDSTTEHDVLLAG